MARPLPERVSVVGNSGSGKTHLARRLADRLGVPFVELDAILHQAGWRELEADELLARVDEVTSGRGWVVDGNYRTVVVDGPVWERADTVVWLDIPRPRVMYQVVTRTLRRMILRTELWNGNREPLSNLWSMNPDRSIIRWSWTQHATYAERFGSAMTDPARKHLEFVRLRSRAEADRWLESLG